MPTLIVEDGTGVADANTYVDLIYLASYASDRGLTLPTLDVDREVYLLRAMDYLESRRAIFQGSKTDPAQSLQWPREGAQIDCEDIANDVIPVELKRAQSQLVVEQQQGTKLFPTPRTSTTDGFVIEKTVGPLTKRWAPGGAGTVSPLIPIKIASVEIFLKPLTIAGSCCGSSGLNTVRL